MILAKFLNKLFTIGGFVLIGANQVKYLIGNPVGEKPLTMILLKKDLHWKLLWPDYYLGLAYMEGSIKFENGNLCNFLELALKNLGRRDSNVIAKTINKIKGTWSYLTSFSTIEAARISAKHHYDVGGEKGEALYSMYLDKNRQYSCAYWSEQNMNLDDAQISMMDHIIKKLRLAEGKSKVLDIGCGWGGLAMRIAKKTGCQVTGITLSETQLRYAKEKARELKLDNLCEFRFEDYRETKEKYDRVVSKGMAEHVGRKYYKTYFKAIYDRLASGGISLVHLIGSIDKPREPQPWITKFIFKRGYTPSLSELMPSIESSKLVLNDLEILDGFHYANTIKIWKERFLKNIDKVEKLYDSTFARMWHFYLSSCQYSFQYRDLVTIQLQLAKDTKLLPITRQYIYQ